MTAVLTETQIELLSKMTYLSKMQTSLRLYTFIVRNPSSECSDVTSTSVSNILHFLLKLLATFC